ncbi:MAG: ergothioneine biosynthesis protein EgtB [Legionella sp.]|nr:ergothioneine biosynthesis protein EgtB [Legionella sp.]
MLEKYLSNPADLISGYKATRRHTEDLCKELLIEDYIIQTMDDVSPPKWHLAHTTWFFETFILNKYTDHVNPNQNFQTIFNSYYQGVCSPYPRGKRGFLARPSIQAIYEYRHLIDEKLLNLIKNSSKALLHELQPILTLGINHEQQHQELLIMDIKYNLFCDPSLPAYTQNKNLNIPSSHIEKQFLYMPGGLIDIGFEGEALDFCFDNELPRHHTYIHPFFISNGLITNQEYCEFIEEKGYSNPSLWLADGWEWLQNNHIQAPLFWQLREGAWFNFTLNGLKKLDLTKPVSHISFFEAEAFARWKNARLPTEEEWEFAMRHLQQSKCTTEDYTGIGALWEWTTSAYLPYPGYKPLAGTIGEYNAKFMNNQRVLRGGSFATASGHTRVSYRNYYGPDKRWQFSGIRLAKNN